MGRQSIQTLTTEAMRKIVAGDLDDSGGVGGDASAANQTTIIGHVDGLETAVASTNTKLDTVNTNLTTIDGRVDGLETAVASTNTKLDTVNTNLTTIDGRVDGLETNTTSLLKAPATFAAGTVMSPYGRFAEITKTITPGTAYVVNQSIGGLQTIDVETALGVDMSNKWIQITSIEVVLQATAATAVSTPVIFNANPSASTVTDATLSNLNSADVGKLVAYTNTSASGGAVTFPNGAFWLNQYTSKNGMMVQCDADGKIYIVLMAGGTFTLTGPNMILRVQFGYDG